KVGFADSLIRPDRNNFGPRLGFAWSPSRLRESTVVRGGFGVAYDRTDDVLFSNARGNPPAFSRFNLCCGTSTQDFSTPFDGGLLFDFYYRYSKSIDQLSNEGPGAQTNQTDPARPQNEHGPSDFDAKHSLTASALWDLPIYRTRTDWVGKVVGGWQVNTIVSAHTGFPWTPVTGQISSVAITSAANINPTRPSALLQQPPRDTSNNAFINPNFNFPGIVRNGNCNPANGTLQGSPYFNICTPGPPGIGRNSFRGPHYFGLDLS